MVNPNYEVPIKWTKTPRTAMLRLAEALGWAVESAGKKWQITNRQESAGLLYTSISLLAFMTRVTMAPMHWQGEGMTGTEVRELIRFRPDHTYDPKGHRLALDGKIAATDETTMYAAYFNEETP